MVCEFDVLLLQVFSELKQMTIPSSALRAEVVAAIGDEVVYLKFSLI